MADKETKDKPKRKHFHGVRSEESHDGKHIIHHHTYKGHRDDTVTEPERMNAAVSSSPEEAGQHVADMFAQNEPPDAEAGAGGPPAAAAGPDQGGAPAAGE